MNFTNLKDDTKDDRHTDEQTTTKIKVDAWHGQNETGSQEEIGKSTKKNLMLHLEKNTRSTMN